MEMNYDEKVLHELEEELNVEILPGTEIMADVGSRHFVKSNAGVLVPQPTDDPRDPLNWNAFWKFSTMACVTIESSAQGMGPLSLAPMFPQLMKAFHCDLADAVQFTGVCILILGFSNFIWVPLATCFGRRPVILASTLICLGSNIWRAQAQTYSSFMGACILNGIGAGPAESLQPTVITDIMFLHERGRYNTLYFFFYWGSITIGPVVAGVMAEYSNWRNYWWLNVALHAFIFLICLVGFPETKWHRVHPSETPRTAPATHSQSSDEPKEKIAAHDDITIEKMDAKLGAGGDGDLSKQATAVRDPYLGKGKPDKRQFSLYQPNSNPIKSLMLDFWTPWKLLAFPIVEFAAFVVSWSASSFLTLNLTQSQVFAAAPYNFPPQSVGFTNFATFAGSLLGLLIAGPMSDWISARLTKRNRGIREPEMRLLAMVPFVFVMILGNFVVAFGYQYKWDWRAIVIIGYGCGGLQVAALPSIAATYAVDSYKPVTGSVFVSITINKNLWGYGFSAFITPWSLRSGFIPPIMTNMCLITLWCSFGFLFWYLGKRFRYWTRNSSVHRM